MPSARSSEERPPSLVCPQRCLFLLPTQCLEFRESRYVASFHPPLIPSPGSNGRFALRGPAMVLGANTKKRRGSQQFPQVRYRIGWREQVVGLRQFLPSQAKPAWKRKRQSESETEMRRTASSTRRGYRLVGYLLVATCYGMTEKESSQIHAPCAPLFIWPVGPIVSV